MSGEPNMWHKLNPTLNAQAKNGQKTDLVARTQADCSDTAESKAGSQLVAEGDMIRKWDWASMKQERLPFFIVSQVEQVKGIGYRLGCQGIL